MRRFKLILATGAAVAAVALPALVPLPPRLVWNGSASAPIGLYALQPADAPEVGDLLAVTPSAPLATFLAGRDYLPRGAVLMKYVAARPGQIVCRRGARLWIDGRAAGLARRRDSHGRPLPCWRGCRTVAADELFLMNFDASDSFDGRYIGPTPAGAVLGRARPIWPHGVRKRTVSGRRPAVPLPSDRSPQ